MLIKQFISLTKPGILFANLITTAAGFFLASKGIINYSLLLSVLTGLALVMASGCVINNYIDSDIDALMERTKNRALVTGVISRTSAIWYGSILGILGFTILFLRTNFLSVAISVVGLFSYVVLYSLWSKRRSIYGTHVGAISGAIPPVVGYCAVSNNLDPAAITLFFILFLWQIPHFFAIAIFRMNDYFAASIPVLPVKKGVYYTKITMLIYITLFAFTIPILSILGYTGRNYLIVVICVGILWMIRSVLGFKITDNKRWARMMFIFSILALIIICVMMSVDFN